MHESFFSEVEEQGWQVKLFPPVSKVFMENKLKELKKLTDEDTLISINQIVMSLEVNKIKLNATNEKFLKQCKEINMEYEFCTLIDHNKDIVEKPDLMVPYISSDTYVVFNKRLIHSYAKQMPFSEMLSAFYFSPPDIYSKVFFNRTPHFQAHPQYDPVFYCEICFDHQFEKCNIPLGQLFWVLLSNSVEDND